MYYIFLIIQHLLPRKTYIYLVLSKSLLYALIFGRNTLPKILQFHLISWWGSFLERHSFCKISDEFPETIWKLCLSTKFSHCKIRGNYFILRGDINKGIFLSIFVANEIFKTFLFQPKQTLEDTNTLSNLYFLLKQVFYVGETFWSQYHQTL